jgi:hypothetical protein
MCSLCAALGGSRYWTDAAGQPGFEKSGLKLSLMTERRRRVALLNRILALYEARICDWGGSSYVLEDQTGRAENIYNLAGVWAQVDQLANRLCDPLDPALIEKLNSEPQGPAT